MMEIYNVALVFYLGLFITILAFLKFVRYNTKYKLII